MLGWLKGLARFDLGVSSQYGGRPVAPIVAERAANTAKLATLALLAATIVGVPLGILTGSRPRSVFSGVVTVLSIALVSCPPLVGALALLFLAVTTHWLSSTPGGLVIPVLALALPLAAMFERLQSQTTAEALHAPDLLSAASRGIGPARLLWIHAARQSLRPLLGVYGIAIGSLFSGSLAVELITGWPGLGRLAYDALISRDLFLIAGCALFGAICLAVGNLVADILRAIVDPRVRE
jgi:peptide/nickel transport system permease protein